MSEHIDPEPVRRHFTEKIGGDRDLLPKDNESLVDEGILDSFALSELGAMIQEVYGIEVPDEDLSLANFESIDKIVAYLAARS